VLLGFYLARSRYQEEWFLVAYVHVGI